MFSPISKGVFRTPPPKDPPFPTRYQGHAHWEPVHTRPRASFLGNGQGSPGDEPAGAGEATGRRPLDDAQGQSRSPVHAGPRILSIGGGKGGIGKSLFATNTAVSLAQMGYQVTLVDLDLGAANLHTCLGMPAPKRGLFDFVSGAAENLEEVCTPTQFPGLSLLAGGQEFWQQIRPQSLQKIKLISKLQQLRSDYVLLDLGAGTHVNTLDFFIFSHAGIVVVMAEPTSIENAYVFLKSALYRKLQSIFKALNLEDAASPLMDDLGDPKNPTPPLVQLQSFASSLGSQGNRILELTEMTRLGIVVNQVRTKNDESIGHSMEQICRKYFGFQANYLGCAWYDDAVWKSVRNRRPLCLDFPHSRVTTNIQDIARTLAQNFLPCTSIESEVAPVA